MLGEIIAGSAIVVAFVGLLISIFGLVASLETTLGSEIIALSIVLAIFGRIMQARAHHLETLEAVMQK